MRGGVLLLVIAAAVAMVIGPAQAAPSSKLYSASAAGSVPAGGTGTVTLTLTNATASSQTLGSAKFAPPSALTVTSLPTATGGDRAWSVAASGTGLLMAAGSSANALQPGESVTAAVGVSAPGCTAGTFAWTTQAKQANDFNGTGNDFKRQGPEPQTVVTLGGGAAAALQFVQEPPDEVEKGAAFTVSVKVVDTCGADTTSSESASLAFGSNPGGATALALPSQSLSSGTGTFSGVSVDKSGAGYTLVASATGLDSATSEPFTVLDGICTRSDPGDVCTATDDSGTTTVSVPEPPTTDGSVSFLFSGLNASFTCGGDALTSLGALAMVDPSQGDYTDPIDVRFLWEGVVPQNSVAHPTFCLSKDGVSYLEPPACNRKSTNLPCEVSRNATGVASLEIVIRIEPEDPWGGIG